MISEAALALPIDAPKSKHSLLPLLTVLFLISYGLMVLLVIEQNRTITSQRWLITELMSDSKELTTLKGKLLSERRNAEKHPGSKAQNPSPQAQAQQGNNNSKTRRSAPERPPRLASDVPDVRRALNTI
ncbi:MAG TPA: hypothetical protein VF011_10335 [Terriglobales bacterium]